MVNTKAGKAVLNRDQFLAIDDRRTQEVEVDGGYLLIREMDGAAVMSFAMTMEGKADSPEAKEAQRQAIYRAIAKSVVDPDTDELMFTMEDVELLARKSWRTLNNLQNAIMKLNGMDAEAIEAAKNASSGAGGSASSTG